MMGNSVTRFGGCETVGRNHIGKLGEEVGNTFRSGEKIGFEWSRFGVWRSWQHDGWRGWRIGTKNSLVGNI